MSDGALTCLMGVLDALLLIWVPVALFAGKRSGASVTILVEIIAVFVAVAFEIMRRVWKCSK